MPFAIHHTASPARAVAASLLAVALAFAAVVTGSTAASAGDLVVTYDQSQLLRLPRPAAELIVGNPSIADITVQSGNLLVITGKTFGVTNLIALDADRNIIQDQRIVVTRDEAGTVNLHKAGKRQSYTCTPDCSPTIVIGDDSDYFETVKKHAEGKTKFSESGANGSDQQGMQ
jgi:Flp pilus assembly secretin CpaC